MFTSHHIKIIDNVKNGSTRPQLNVQVNTHAKKNIQRCFTGFEKCINMFSRSSNIILKNN